MKLNFQDHTNVLNSLLNYGLTPNRILDVGGYHGNWTKTCLNIFPNAIYDVIEPIIYNELNYIKNKPNVNIYHELLSNDIKQVEWWENKNSGDSIYRERSKHFANVIPQIKTTTTINKLFPINTIFDIIKIDVQGAELDVLEGGKGIVEKSSIIILEMPFMGQYNYNAPSFLEYITYMNSIGFIPYDVVEIHTSASISVQVDIAFIRKNHDIVNIIQNKIDSSGS